MNFSQLKFVKATSEFKSFTKAAKISFEARWLSKDNKSLKKLIQHFKQNSEEIVRGIAEQIDGLILMPDSSEALLNIRCWPKAPVPMNYMNDYIVPIRDYLADQVRAPRMTAKTQ